MKQTLTLVGLGAALIFAGCQQATDSDKDSGPETKSLTVVSTSSTVYTYWDLATGSEVTDPATTDWDVAFNGATGGILTNSGASKGTTAANGGVYYSGSTDFDSVDSVNSTRFSEAFAVDTQTYVSATQDGVNYTTTQPVLNQITKLAYASGDGTSGTPYVNDGTEAVYAGDAYYAYNATTHQFSASGEVYVIRHGDGSGTSKFQITSMTGTSTNRTRVIKYANF